MKQFRISKLVGVLSCPKRTEQNSSETYSRHKTSFQNICSHILYDKGIASFSGPPPSVLPTPGKNYQSQFL